MSTKIVQAYNKVFATSFQNDYPSALLHDVALESVNITVSPEDYVFVAREPRLYMPENRRPGQDGPCWMGIPVKVVE